MKPAITAIIACAAALALPAGASAQGPKTTADWVAQLGADNLKDRDAASAALLSLGAKSRDAVRDGLDSKDPEVQARSKELWKTLRWLVIPGADTDIKEMVAEADKGTIEASLWQGFVQKHGAESIRLVAEFREEAVRKEGAAPDNGGGETQVPTEDTNTVRVPISGADKYRAIYESGLHTVLDNAPPVEVARVIAQTDSPKERAALEALLDEYEHASTELPEKTAANWMQIQIALWNYEKAYNFGRDYAFRTTGYEVVKQCAIAVDRGTLFDKIDDAAKKDIASENDPGRLCVKLSFYTSLFSALDKKPFIGPLYDLLPKDATASADDASLRRLVESLLNARMPERAVKALHNVQSAMALYMRSAADLQMQNEPVANADWGDVMNALDSVDDAKKKESYYEVGELMRDWHDERVVVLWQKVLSLPPADTVYDANVSFRMGEYMESHHQYAQAAEFYEKGMQIGSKITNGIMIATTPDGRSAGSGQQAVLDKIRQLKSEAAEQKSIFDNPPPAEGGNNGPQ